MDLSRLRAKVKELQEKKNSQFGEVKKVIQNGVPNIVRLVGEWSSVKRAWLECDDGKAKPFNIANDKQESSILLEAILLVTEQETLFDPQTGKTFKRYKYVDKLQHIADKIFPNKGTRGWSFSESFVLNCIDRMDDWCELNNHTKLLVKTPSEIGIGGTAFQGLQAVIDSWGDPEKYDLNFTKTGADLNTKYNVQPVNPEMFSQVINGPLTEKEKSYELYDIRQITELSEADFILQHLGNLLQKIDTSLGTNFVNRLKENKVSVQQIKVVQPTDKPFSDPEKVPLPEIQQITPPVQESQPRPFSFKKAESNPTVQPKTDQPKTVQSKTVQPKTVQPNLFSQTTTTIPTEGTVFCPLCGEPVSESGVCEKCGIKVL